MSLPKNLDKSLPYAIAALGGLLVAVVIRWDSGSLAEVLKGREGVKTLALGILLGAGVIVLLHKLLEGHFPWQPKPPRSAKRPGAVLQRVVGAETAPLTAPGDARRHGHDSAALEEIRASIAKVNQTLSTLIAKMDATPAPATPKEDNEYVSKALGSLSSQMEAALRNAREEVERRDKANEALTANLTKANILRTLTRFATALELARAVSAKVAEGKTSGADGLEFVLGDLESALADNNVHPEQLAVGTPIKDLPAGSFTPMAYVDAENPSQAGTIKEARSAAYFIPDEDGRKRYIAPAKVIAYKANNG
jgi:hypothetical protein